MNAEMKNRVLDGAEGFLPVFADGSTLKAPRPSSELIAAVRHQAKRDETGIGGPGVMIIIPKRRFVTGGAVKINGVI